MDPDSVTMSPIVDTEFVFGVCPHDFGLALAQSSLDVLLVLPYRIGDVYSVIPY